MSPLWVSVALAGSVGLELGPVAVRQAARHAVTPSVGAWGTGRLPVGLVLGGEAALWRRRVESSLYEHDRFAITGAALVGWGVQERTLAADWAVGPAAGLERGEVGGRAFLQPSAGLRLRNALEVQLFEAVVARASLGAWCWGLSRWDFDAMGGLGVAW